MNQDRKSVFSNFIALAISQGTNLLVPILLTPYLIKAVGISNYGAIGLVQTVMLIVAILVDYGFNVTAVKQVSINREDKVFIGQILVETILIRLLLSCLGAFFVVLLVWGVPKFQVHREAFYLGCSLIVGQALLPSFFFQGIEDMKQITYLNIFAKALSVFAIVLYVGEKADYVLVVFFIGLGNVLAGFLGLCLAFYKFKFRLFLPSLSNISFHLKDGLQVVVSNLLVGAIMYSNIIFIGLLLSEAEVGLYSVAEKVMMGLWQLLVVFSQAVYPKACQLSQATQGALSRFYRSVSLPFSLLVLVLGWAVCFFAPSIVGLLAGSVHKSSVELLQIMAFVPFIVSLNIPGYQTLLVHNLKKDYLRVFVITTLFAFFATPLFLYWLGIKGAALSVLFTNTILTVLFYVIIEYKHPQISLFHSLSTTKS